jgi:hypothetical protein
MRLAYLALAAVLAPSIAAACPAPPPGEEEHYHCSKYDKYDHVQADEKVLAPPPEQIYARAGRAKYPRSKKRLMRLLTTSIWRAGSDLVQFLDGSDIPDVIDLHDGARSEIVRTIEATDDGWHVSTDADGYDVHPCKIGRRATVCIVRS